MGNQLAYYWTNTEYHPDHKTDPIYPTQDGFEGPRKKREMKVTWEEMQMAGLEYGLRDYCAHHWMNLHKCYKEYYEDSSKGYRHCFHHRHEWEHCELEDQIMRMKEYEREKRLLAMKKVADHDKKI